MPKVSLLYDVDPVAVSIVKRGANRQRFFLMKSDGTLSEEPVDGAESLIASPAEERLIHKADWSVVYCVVAEPGARENPGVLAKAGDPDDEWGSEDEIRKAASRFMKNGGLINKMHEDLEPYGAVVENAIALADFEVNGHTIKKGSWYIGIEPTDDGRKAIEDGEFTGVSLQGTGRRELVEVEKGTDRAPAASYGKCASCGSKTARGVKTCPNCGKSAVAKAGVTHERTIGSKGKSLFNLPGDKQLPAMIQRVYNDLVESGRPVGGMTYRLAVGIVKNWAAGHDGKGNKVSAKTQAQAAAAIAEWEKLKGEAKAKPNKGTKGALAKIASVLGIDVDAELAEEEWEPLEKGELEEELAGVDVAELEKAAAALTPFADRIAARRAGDEISRAHDAMRGVLYDHFYPYTPEGEAIAPEDARKSLARSLNQYRDHVLGLHDGLGTGDIKKSHDELRDDLATLRMNTPDGDDTEDDLDMGDTNRIEALEKSVGDLNTKLDSLATSLTPLVKRLEEAEAPKPEDLQKQMGDLAKGMETLQKGLERLGEGSSTDRTDDRTDVKKSGPLAGLLA